MSQNDEQSPDEPLGTETFEQGDEALDEESRLDPDFLEDVERDPSLDPTLLVDDLELEEAGATFDDPEAMATLDGGIDDPDGVGIAAGRQDPEWDDEGLGSRRLRRRRAHPSTVSAPGCCGVDTSSRVWSSFTCALLRNRPTDVRGGWGVRMRS